MSAWKLTYSQSALKWFRKTDNVTKKRIQEALIAIIETNNPRVRGKALSGPLTGLWRYRVGNIRIICEILDNQLTVLVIDIGNRDHIYD